MGERRVGEGRVREGSVRGECERRECERGECERGECERGSRREGSVREGCGCRTNTSYHLMFQLILVWCKKTVSNQIKSNQIYSQQQAYYFTWFFVYTNMLSG